MHLSKTQIDRLGEKLRAGTYGEEELRVLDEYRHMFGTPYDDVVERLRTVVDAPVSGRPPGMTVMVGGSEDAFTRCLPLFKAIAANIFHVGPSGAGVTAKLVTQYLGYTAFIASLEGMLIAAKAGIDLNVLARIVPVSAGQSRTFDNIPRGVFPRTFTAGGTLDIVAKDVALACELARDVGAPAALGTLASDVYQRAQAQGWGQDGFPVVARVLEAMAGMELRPGIGGQA